MPFCAEQSNPVLHTETDDEQKNNERER